MKSNSRFKASFHLTIELDEEEARAMEALAGYGTDAFIKTFYKEMGESYLKPHEAGLRRILDAFYTDVKHNLHKVDQAKKLFTP